MDRPLRFVKRLGAIYRVLLETPAGCWLTDCNGPSPPFFEADLYRYERVPAPESWISEQINTPAQEARLQMIQPLLDCTGCTSDKSLRYQMAAEVAQQHKTTTRRVLRLYYRYLATGRLTAKRAARKQTQNSQAIERAIRQYYYGSKRLSLRSAYEMMLLEDYVGPEGEMDSDAPTWSQFRHYYYGHSLHKDPQKIIAREGLTKYQRDHRPAWGSSAGWRPQPGSYQMDATQADIYLVSRQERSIVVGRPYIYLAVDTATHLIAGVYIGFSCDETAVMACIEQATMDKVAYCARYWAMFFYYGNGYWWERSIPAQPEDMDAYVLEHDNPIKDGETVDGVADGQMSREIQWKCRYEDALIQPPRGVLDIHMGEFAAGQR